MVKRFWEYKEDEKITISKFLAFSTRTLYDVLNYNIRIQLTPYLLFKSIKKYQDFRNSPMPFFDGENYYKYPGEGIARTSVLFLAPLLFVMQEYFYVDQAINHNRASLMALPIITNFFSMVNEVINKKKNSSKLENIID